ncbi:MAG: KdsC family phosphatase [Planctomycetota bacterium]
MLTTHVPEAFRLCPPNTLFLDVDGVLTNNQIVISALGVESKCFHVPDGLGIQMLRKSGVRVGFISGRASLVVEIRARELGVDWQMSGVADKRVALRDLALREQVDLARSVYVGDDLVDLPAMSCVGLPVAVANAHAAIKERAAATTLARGGEGAVREVCEWILRARGDWERIMESHNE